MIRALADPLAVRLEPLLARRSQTARRRNRDLFNLRYCACDRLSAILGSPHLERPGFLVFKRTANGSRGVVAR